MGKKRQHNIARHIKTSHKKSLIKRNITNKKVDAAIRDINKTVSKEIDARNKAKKV